MNAAPTVTADIVGKSEAIMLADLPTELVAGRVVPAASVSAALPVRLGEPQAANEIPVLARALFTWARAQSKLKVLPAVERELVICALAETHGNQVQAAKLLGITRATLRKRIEKFGIQQELSIR